MSQRFAHYLRRHHLALLAFYITGIRDACPTTITRKVRMPRISYANVVSTLALFLVLGGGASYATGLLPANSVGTKQLKNGAVTGAKVKNGSLLANDFKAGQLPAGTQGPAGPAGAAGAAGVVGATGAKGDAGPVGLGPAFTAFVPQGTLFTGTGAQQILILHLPSPGTISFTAGSYFVYANVEFQRSETNATIPDDVVCTLEDSGVNLDGPLDQAEVVLPPSPARATISLMAAANLSASAFLFPPIWLRCSRSGSGVGDVTFYDADIGAIKLSSVS